MPGDGMVKTTRTEGGVRPLFTNIINPTGRSGNKQSGKSYCIFGTKGRKRRKSVETVLQNQQSDRYNMKEATAGYLCERERMP